MRQAIERIRHMLRVKDCRHICLLCEYFDICKAEIEEQEAEGGEKDGTKPDIQRGLR